MRLEKMVVSDEFRRLKGVHYMDHAAGTLYSEQQMRDVMEDLCSSVYGNPHSLSIVSKQTDNVVDQIRYRVLQHFNTNADEYDIIFTSGATAALKLVAESFNFGCDQKGAFVYKQENHTSILGMREVVAERCSSIKSLSLKVLTNLFSPHTKRAAVETKCNSGVGNSLFAVSAQCNFSGAKMPLEWVEMVQDGILENAMKLLVGSLDKHGNIWEMVPPCRCGAARTVRERCRGPEQGGGPQRRQLGANAAGRVDGRILCTMVSCM